MKKLFVLFAAAAMTLLDLMMDNMTSKISYLKEIYK